MQAYGTLEGRRVVLEVSGRARALRVLDDETGQEIDRHERGTGRALALDGNSLLLGDRTIVLDQGEEGEAAALLRVHGSPVPASSSHGPVSATPDGSRLVAEDISHDELMREMRRQDVIAVSSRATAASAVVTAVLVVFGVLAVIAGLLVALSTRSTFDGTEHPYVGTGAAIAIGGIVQMSVGLMLSMAVGSVAQYIRYKAEFEPIR